MIQLCLDFICVAYSGNDIMVSSSLILLNAEIEVVN